ncbi:unnamed protein product [Paramecium sonneborni]|uniref:Uncharacterized protein n=1 Tax=Paramecium sonneborni TaxID=65129 RepID=A0A8S1QSS1_9CILI|nr:unnamed protein product [Paramecium sonneborni]
MDKLSKNLDKFYTQIYNQKKVVRNTSRDSNDPSNTSIDMQINPQKQQKKKTYILKED